MCMVQMEANLGHTTFHLAISKWNNRLPRRDHAKQHISPQRHNLPAVKQDTVTIGNCLTNGFGFLLGLEHGPPKCIIPNLLKDRKHRNDKAETKSNKTSSL